MTWWSFPVSSQDLKVVFLVILLIWLAWETKRLSLTSTSFLDVFKLQSCANLQVPNWFSSVLGNTDKRKEGKVESWWQQVNIVVNI